MNSEASVAVGGGGIRMLGRLIPSIDRAGSMDYVENIIKSEVDSVRYHEEDWI